MRIAVRNSVSPLGFATQGGQNWKAWDRYITIAGREAWHIGNVCGTCAFFFERLSGANQSLNPRDLQDRLSAGLSALTDSEAATISELLPDGEYEASLLFRIPRLVTPGDADDYFCREEPALWGIDAFTNLPHDPRTRYYRGSDRLLGGGAGLFEFLIPMFPENWLDPDRVAEFERHLAAGGRPTALAISVLDVKGPADWVGDPAVTSHWCLAHYLIDGHHKVYAASKTGRPVGLVSLLALQQGVTYPEQLDTLLASQAAAPDPTAAGTGTEV